MLRSPRVWLYAAATWLILAGLAHTAAHVWNFVLEEGMVGQREFAMNAMKQAFSTEPLQPSLWRIFRVFSLSFGLMLIFAGVIDFLLAWTEAPARIQKNVALFATFFWTAAFVPYALVDPVFQTLVITIVAVPLHAVAYLTASEAADEAAGPLGTDSG